MNDIELKRQLLQKRLDAKKSLPERNKLGQYSTPYPLASTICKIIRPLVGDTIESVLEPAIGTGVFFSALSEQYKIAKFVGYEIDSHYFIPSASLWANSNIKLFNQDFLTAQATEKFSLIISNPPYSRHHHIMPEMKKYLSNKIKDTFGIEVSGLSGLYVYFVILSTLWLKKDGYSCWLIPSEFLTVNYGRAFKQFLSESVDLISIHTFTANDVQFNDALVSSSILVFKNSKPSQSPVKFSWGDNLENPEDILLINRDQLEYNQKWNKSFFQNKVGMGYNQSDVRIGNYFSIKRGIATGDNSFFIIDKETVKTYDIPTSFVKPVVPPPRKLKSNIYSIAQSEIDGSYLIDCSLPLDVIKNKYNGLFNYLKFGIANEVNMRANCKNRELWYKCETRDTAPILVSYMGRDNGKSPIRFILNEAKATATNSYLMMYPKPEYRHQFRDPAFTKKIWLILSEIPTQSLLDYGRIYGGGLLKLEPKELAEIPCPQLKEVLSPLYPSLFE